MQDARDLENIDASNLVCIGGGKYNAATDAVNTRIVNSLPYSTRRSILPTPEALQYSDADLKTFVEVSTRESAYAIDFAARKVHGMVVAARNPFNSTGWVLIMYGQTPSATRACMRWIQSLRWREYLKHRRVLGSEFQAIFEVVAIGSLETTKPKTIFVGGLRGGR